jgi:hypothetical protein
MTPVKLSAIAILAILAAACSGTGPGTDAATGMAAGPALIEGTGVTATVTERTDGRFDIDYVFAEPHAAMVFSRSAGDHRIGAWTPQEEGVRLERLNGLDTLVFDAPRSHVSLIAEPRFVSPEGDYSPFVDFSDGGLALFTGQFELLPVADAEAAAALDGRLDRWQGDQPVLGVRVRSGRRIVFDGAVREGAIEHTTTGGGAFVYLGDGEIVEGRSYVGVIDRALPDWVLASVESDMEAIFETYEARWEHPLTDKAVLYFAFGGYDHPGFSNKGGVAGSVIMLDSSGEAMREASPALHSYLNWFFAHEVAHQFQNISPARQGERADSWIHEGGANTMANAVVAGMDGGAAYLDAAYAQAWAGCLPVLETGPLQGAGARGAFNAYYDCGSLVSLIAAAGTPGGDLYAIWQAMQSAAVEMDEPIGSALFFAAMGGLGAPAELTGLLREVVVSGVDDPAAALQEAMDMAGLSAEFDAQGQLTGFSETP